MHVLGRREGGERDATGPTGGSEPTGRLGWFRARDGSRGAPVGVDLDRPHAGLVVGKRGSGKSYTLGVFAEELAATGGVAPVVLDPLDAFDGLEVCGFVTRNPRIRAGSLDPPAWCDLLGLDPTDPAGSVVWRAASERGSLDGMRSFVDDAAVPDPTTRAASNHLDLAASWGVFDPAGLDPAALTTRPTRISLSGLDPEPASAVVSAVLGGCYRARLREATDRLPWLLVDEAHAFVGSVAEPALRRVLTRGRAPGTSLVLATQRPSALPEVAASQADLLIAHRLTGRADREALERARPAVARIGAERRPEEPGEAVVFDDTGESVHAVRVRERETPHGGSAPRVSERFSPRVGRPSAPDDGETDTAASDDPGTRRSTTPGEPTATGTGGESDGA
ncbi:ATP-binding protein [Salinirubellus sp. GCM10025818]|uniref:ATP-binding protein n=1 Tax=Salinirubellus TaxID=2162630 RepID=UPI0030CC13E0